VIHASLRFSWAMSFGTEMSAIPVYIDEDKDLLSAVLDFKWYTLTLTAPEQIPLRSSISSSR